MTRSSRWTLAAALLASCALAAPGWAQEAPDEDSESFRVGASVGYSSLFERPFLAADFIVPLGGPFAIVPNASFTNRRTVRRYTVGLELQWNPPAHRLHRKLLGWVGGGLGFVSEDPKGPREGTTRDLLATVVLGAGYDAPAAPFVQVRAGFNDDTDVGLSVGVRF